MAVLTRARAAALGALAAMLLGSAAGADDRHDAADTDTDEPQDFDADAEQYSKLWSGDLFPADAEYQELVGKAREMWTQRGENSFRQAIELLDKAVAMAPEQPLAHGWLAGIYARTGEWKRCAAALDKAAARDPSFVPPLTSQEPAYALDFERGMCHAMAGNYELAIARFKHIVSDGHDSPIARQRLGEAYMALGRLDDAIAAFETLLKTRPYDPGLHFALAVAYDRDEQAAPAKAHVELGLKHDPRLTTLSQFQRSYFPPEDEHYYLGLGHAGDSQVMWAVFHFREYLQAAKEGPWAHRARQHLELMLEHTTGVDLVRRGTADVDLERSRAAVTASDAAFQKCAKALPRVLFRVRVTTLASPGRPARRKKAAAAEDEDSSAVRGPRAGAKAMMDLTSEPEPDTETVKPVIECIEQAASQLKLPRPTGASGTYASLEFHVIAR